MSESEYRYDCRIGRLWYRDGFAGGQLLVGEVAFSPDGSVIAAIPVNRDRLDRIATFANWPELPGEVEQWVRQIGSEDRKRYEQRMNSMGNAMSVLNVGDLQALGYRPGEDQVAWLQKSVGDVK